MAGGEGFLRNEYLPPAGNGRPKGAAEQIVLKKIEEKNPQFNHFEMLIFRLANSKNCPYKASELWRMSVERLFSIRELVFVHDALDYAVNKDQQDEVDRSRNK